MLFEAWLAFVAASVVVAIIPGPTVLLVTSIALRYGRGLAGAMTAGVAAGDCLAMIAALTGVGALMQTSAAAFTVLKLAGAGYLAWMGLKLLRAPAAAVDAAEVETLAGRRPTPGAAFRQTFGVALLNPKSILFFVALTPQFANPAAAYPPQAMIMIITFVMIGAINVTTYALAAEHLRGRITPGGVRRLSQMGGAVLIALAAAAAFGSAQSHT